MDVYSGRQLARGVVVLLAFPDHRREPVAVIQLEDCDRLFRFWGVVRQDQVRKVFVIPCVLALRTTTSGLTFIAKLIAVNTVFLGAEFSGCVAPTLPAHHSVVPFTLFL